MNENIIHPNKKIFNSGQNKIESISPVIYLYLNIEVESWNHLLEATIKRVYAIILMMVFGT